MPAVARMGGKDQIACTDGTIGPICNIKPTMWHWNTPTTFSTLAGSSDVFVNGVGVVRFGDGMTPHPDGDPCTPVPIPHAPSLSKGSSTVFANGKPMGRVGDKYNSDNHYDHTIISGSSNVFAG